MSFKRTALSGVNRLVNQAGIHVMSRSEHEDFRAKFCPPAWDSPAVPEEARTVLTLDHPRLVDLRARYRGHPATAHTVWDEGALLGGMSLDRFRGDNHYVYQIRGAPTPESYYLSAYYMREQDKLGLFDDLTEDGLFGAYTLPFDDGRLISRDLLDSINEINFIGRMLLNLDRHSPVRLLDIGAGYGRLAHRMAEAFPNSRSVCTDAVPVSTFLSEFYLGFRGVAERAKTIPLDELGRLQGQSFDVVTNIHSFPECPAAVIDWWLSAIDLLDVKNLMVVPNTLHKFMSHEPNGTRLDFFPLFEQHGWKLTHKEPVYLTHVAQKYALYPDAGHYWFTKG